MSKKESKKKKSMESMVKNSYVDPIAPTFSLGQKRWQIRVGATQTFSMLK